MPNLRDEDWLRARSWDLPTRLDSLLIVLAGPGASEQKQRRALREFVRLPAAEAMPAGLRRQVDAFLA